MISVILNSYNPTQQQAHMTMACLAAVRKFTDPEYELIVVDNAPVHRIRDEFKVLNIDNLITNKRNQTSSYSFHQGAKVAKGESLVFIQSDVFVHERTINKLVKYLDRYDVAYPQQYPLHREEVKEIYGVADGEDTRIGARDEGMIAIRKDSYEKCGGWDVRFKNMLAGKAFYMRCDKAGLTWTDKTNAFITHIMAGNNLLKAPGLYNKQMAHDAELIKKYYD